LLWYLLIIIQIKVSADCVYLCIDCISKKFCSNSCTKNWMNFPVKFVLSGGEHDHRSWSKQFFLALVLNSFGILFLILQTSHLGKCFSAFEAKSLTYNKHCCFALVRWDSTRACIRSLQNHYTVALHCLWKNPLSSMLFELNSSVLASMATSKDWVLPGMGNEDKADLVAILLYLFA